MTALVAPKALKGRLVLWGKRTLIGGAMMAGLVGGITHLVRPARPEGWPQDVSANEMNKMQDEAALHKFVLQNIGTLRQSGVELLEMRGCPQCSRVKTLLQFYQVPFNTVTVDPVTLKTVADRPFRQCPQLVFTNVSSKIAPETLARFPWLKNGPNLVDANEIIGSLAPTLGYTDQLSRHEEEMLRMSSRLPKLMFAVSNATFSRAKEAFPLSMPRWWDYSALRLIGGGFSFGLARTMFAPRIVAESFRAKQAGSISGAVSAKKEETNFTVERLDAVLTAELRRFRDDCLTAPATPTKPRPQEYSKFAGGAKPDLRDLTLYGLLRPHMEHSAVRECLLTLGVSMTNWFDAMEEAVAPV